MTMFFFDDASEWQAYMEELGLNQAIRNLESRGHPSGWVTKIFGEADGARFHPGGGKFHRSECPRYDGYWWAGGFGSVQCGASRGLLPGLVYENVCSKNYPGCPFYRKQGECNEL